MMLCEHTDRKEIVASTNKMVSDCHGLTFGCFGSDPQTEQEKKIFSSIESGNTLMGDEWRIWRKDLIGLEPWDWLETVKQCKAL
jgi:hypothetical protein